MLAERERPANVVNMGQGDTGPDQQLRLLKKFLLPRLTPDTVVWSFYATGVFGNLRQPVYEIDSGALAPLFFSSLAAKKALHEAGLSISYLSRSFHGPSNSEFGRRYINAIKTRREEHYLRDGLASLSTQSVTMDRRPSFIHGPV